MRGAPVASARALSTSVHASSPHEECACPSWDPGADPVGVALPNVPERQRAGAVVSHADQGAERRAQDDNDLARKLLIALWRLATTDEPPDGVELRPATRAIL
jgi:hypothetical protein